MKSINRKEAFMAAIAGEGEAPKPLTREEELAGKIADRIGQGGAVEITLSRVSQAAFAELLGQFITAALTNAGEYTISLATGISEYADIQAAAAQGERVIVITETATSEVISYSANHVAFHIIIPMYNVQGQTISMVLDVSLMSNGTMIQGFAKVLDI